MKKIILFILCFASITLSGCKAIDFQSEQLSTKLSSNGSSDVDNNALWQDLPKEFDINDLKAVSKAFIDPLKPAGYPWFYSWDGMREIDSNDYISILSYYNYLNLPLDSDRYKEPYVDAKLVEEEVFKRFGIEKEYLRTSQLYNPESNTYLFLVGGGGPDRFVVSSFKKDGKIITIKLSYHYLSNTIQPNLINSFLPNNQQSALDYGYSSGFLFSFGNLYAELSYDESSFRYISYKLYDEKFARHDSIKVAS